MQKTTEVQNMGWKDVLIKAKWSKQNNGDWKAVEKRCHELEKKRMHTHMRLTNSRPTRGNCVLAKEIAAIAKEQIKLNCYFGHSGNMRIINRVAKLPERMGCPS